MAMTSIYKTITLYPNLKKIELLLPLCLLEYRLKRVTLIPPCALLLNLNGSLYKLMEGKATVNTVLNVNNHILRKNN